LSAEGEDLTTSITCFDFSSGISGKGLYYDKIDPLRDTLKQQRGYNIRSKFHQGGTVWILRK